MFTLTTTSAGLPPPFALRSVSTPRDAPDPVTSADFDSEPVGLSRLPRPNPFFFGCSSFFSSAGFSALPPPARPADPASTTAISVCALAL